MDFLAQTPNPSRGYCSGYAGTLAPYENFSAEEDSISLRSAMKGMGTNEKAIIAILGNRTYHQRHAISIQYKQSFGRDLMEDLHSETSGNFRKTLKALMTHPIEYDAWTVHQAIKGIGTDEKDLIEILVTRSNEQIKLINKAYKQKYKETMEKDLIGDTSGDFKRLMVSLNNGSRDESGTVDRGLAQKDAADLYHAGEKKVGTDESTFNRIIVSRNFQQLVATCEEYEKVCKKTLEKVLKSELSGNLLAGMQAIIEFARDPPSYFAHLLKKTMDGFGTNDNDLIRLVVSRSEVDLKDIREAFHAHYGNTLKSWIEGDCDGDYKRLLLAIVA